MAIWNITTQDYLNQERSLFEVYARADRYGRIYDELGQGFSGDLFGRLKVSAPYTLFDSSHRYTQDGDFSDVIVGTGSTSGIITSQSTATLGIGTTAGCSYIRESKRVFSYQPGKALQVLQTFVLNSPQTNLVQRVGYASSENGVMLELNGSQINIIKRTAISGVGTTITVPQSQWNVDTLDGTGISTTNPSGISLDLTKAQILFSEYEWLGVGSVRVGFAIDGKFVIAHQFNHSNKLDSVYMTTATLPIRYEILNIGITSAPSTMKQICASVQSNGGYEKKQALDVVRNTTVVSVAAGQAFIPLLSIRLTPGKEDSVIIPHEFNILPDSTNPTTFEVSLIKNATLTNASFATTATSSPNVQVDFAATAMSGGTIVKNDYVTSANKGTTPLNVSQEYNWDLQLGRTQSKVSDIYTLAMRGISGAGTGMGSIGFYDLT